MGPRIVVSWCRWLGASALCLITAFPSLAANITWGPATTVSGNSDVDTSGSLVYAYEQSNLAAVVTGVSFSAPSNPYPLGRRDLTFLGFNGGVSSRFGPSP